jgi:xylulokinase
MSLLGIDVGTTGCALLAVSREGRLLAHAARDYRVAPGAQGACELDVREIWAALSDALRQVIAETPADAIHALSISSAGEAITPLSGSARILDVCILGHDARGGEYVREVERALGRERFFDITGRVPGASHSLSKLCWLKEYNTQLFQQTWRFVLLGGLVSHLLGGSATCDFSLAAGTMMFDTRQERWSREVLAVCDLPLAKLPELAPAGALLGVVAPHIARELGLRPNVRIVLGGHDVACSALGAGVINSGMAAYAIGNTMHLAPAFNAIVLSSLMLRHGLSMAHHVAPELFLSSIYNRSGGSVLRWFSDRLAPLERREAQARNASVYAVLLSEMPDEPTSLMVLPHFAAVGPPLSDDRSSGVMAGLRLETTRGEIVKALLEGVTYFFASGHQVLGQIGIPVHLYRATGGGARSAAWLQLTADILGVPVERTRLVKPAPLGAAILAGVGCGDYDSVPEAVQVQVQVADRFEPNPRKHALYDERVARYRELYPLLADYLHGLRALQGGARSG